MSQANDYSAASSFILLSEITPSLTKLSISSELKLNRVKISLESCPIKGAPCVIAVEAADYLIACPITEKVFPVAEGILITILRALV